MFLPGLGPSTIFDMMTDSPMILTVYVPRKSIQGLMAGPGGPGIARVCSNDRLPSEILSDIFLLTQEYPDFPTDAPYTFASDFALTVSHVCRFWRQTAIHTQKLWTFIQITHRRPDYPAITRLCLARSGNLPLDITIWWSPAATEIQLSHQDEDDELNALWTRAVSKYRPVLLDHLEILLGQIARWRAFQFVLDDWSTIQSDVSWFVGFTAPNLRALCLSYYHVLSHGEPPHWEPVGAPVGPVFAHDGTPPISDCIIDGMQLGLACVSDRYLTRLVLREQTDNLSPSFQDIITILDHSPNIRTLHIHVYWHSDNPPLDLTKRIHLPSLEQLLLQNVQPVFANALLKQIVVPNIRILELGLEDEFFNDFIDTLVTPYVHSGRSVLRSVEALRVDVIALEAMDPDPDDEIYHKLDNLRVLMVNCNIPYGYDEFLAKILQFTHSTSTLTFPPDHTPAICLPRLSTLVLSDPDIDELKEFIIARREVGFPVKRVLIQLDENGNDPVSERDAEWLARNVELFATFHARSLPTCAVDPILEKLLEADMAAEVEGVSFSEVFAKLY